MTNHHGGPGIIRVAGEDIKRGELVRIDKNGCVYRVGTQGVCPVCGEANASEKKEPPRVVHSECERQSNGWRTPPSTS